MSFASFLRSLFENGRASVPAFGPLTAGEVAEGDRVLAEIESLHRLDQPGQPPEFDPVAARWATVAFFRACQFVVYRDLPAEAMHAELTRGCPRPRSPAIDYSVDLVFRFLPDLLTLARSTSENDPLVKHLHDWAQQWPLSSVGVADLGDLDCSSFSADPALLTLYADRVLVRADASRLADEATRRAIERAAGLHRELAGTLAPLLSPVAEEMRA